MGIGYAILSQTLNISGIANMRGNWNVKITNMELLSENKTGRAEEVSHSFTDTTATFEANLYMPGDSIEYRVTVENQGNIDALLKSITPTTTNRSEGIKFSHSEIDNTVLTAGKTITFTMKVEFLEDATSIPKVDNVKYNLELVYVQYDGGEYTPAIEPAEESCFMISDDGTLLSYDRSCGTDNVVIPAKINNIPVKRVAAVAFASTGASAQTSTGESIYIFKNEEAKTKYIENMRKEGSTDEEINEIMKTSYIYGSAELKALKLKTRKDDVIESGDKYKINKDATGSIKLEKTTSTDYDFIQNEDLYRTGYYCVTSEKCELLKEYFRSKDPAINYGITDSSYYEYLYSFEQTASNGGGHYIGHYFGMLNNLEYISFNGLSNQYGVFKTFDFSQAIYMEELTPYAIVMLTSDDSQQLISKVILPPNIKTINLPFAKEVIFPSNSITEVIFPNTVFQRTVSIESIVFPKTLKAIGNNAFQGKSLTTVVIPSSVVRIGSNAFAEPRLGQGNITSLKFEKDSHLIAIYGSDGSEYDAGAFEGNKLSNVIIPKSVEYIGYHAFAEYNLTTVSFEANSKLKYMDSSVFGVNSNPINLTLTTPTDLSNWPAGTNDNITVVYER